MTVLGLTPPQIASFGIVIAMLVLFAWERWRYDVVAVGILCAAVVLGVVNPHHAFDGFSNPVIVIIASVLVVSKAISASGILDGVMRRLLKDVESTSIQVGVLTACVTFLSAFVKNVGTLGIFMPIAIQTARRTGRSPSIYLMPLAFGSLIGGTITQIGTSPNLLISSVRQNLNLPPYSLFDYAWVGLPLSILAVVFMMVGWRLLPRNRVGQSDGEDFEIEKYTTEMRLTAQSPLVGKTVAELEHLTEGGATVTAIAREGGHHYIPDAYWRLYSGDVVTVMADPAIIKQMMAEGKLELAGAKELEKDEDERDELTVVEAIVTADSPMVGQTPRSLNLRHYYGVNLLAVSRAGHNIHRQLQTHRFEVGDVVALQTWEKGRQIALSELGCLPLADRGLGLGQSRRGLISIGILAVAMILMSLHVVPVAFGFFASAVLVVLLNQVSLKEAYNAIEGPVIVMLAALLPIGEGLKHTGATEVIGNWLAMAGGNLSGPVALAMMLTVSMILTPFLHHAAAVLVLGPVAAVVATQLGYNVDPFLMAVALGCACDFLTPIGHQNNLLVMGPGGYRFSDYWRLGLPLSIMIVVVGTPLIMWAWPLK